VNQDKNCRHCAQSHRAEKIQCARDASARSLRLRKRIYWHGDDSHSI
jgi:hypothetical protein